MSVLDVEAESPIGVQPIVVAESDEHYRRRKLGFWFWASLTWLVLLVLAAILAGHLGLQDPNKTFPNVARKGPSGAHWFGADNIGHDVFSRTIYGARRSLFVAAVATLFGLLMGGVLGLIAGYYRKAIDGGIVAVMNILLAIPGLVFLLTVVAFLAPPGKTSANVQTAWVTAALAVLTVPTITRITRAQTMVWSDRDFVMASRTLGTRNKRIMVREILPNLIPSLVSFAFVLGAGLITIEAALAFFGIGDVSGVSWGLMIQNGRSQLEHSPHMVLFPAAFMCITILALNFVGDQMRARSDVREGGI
jgi:peptide/nickel transport system permease protein